MHPPQLEGLKLVNWAALHHAYGPATDIPDQLKALLSGSAEERSQARRQLGGNIYHQGTRWQASSHVVPFLAELVDAPATPERAGVLGLLRAVAVGDRTDADLPFEPDQAFAAAEIVTDHDVAMTLNWLNGGGTEDGDEPDEAFEAVALSWDRDAYLAAAAISDRFAAWTSDPDPMIAARAAELLAWFPRTQGAISQLLEIPSTHGTEVARASANLSLGYLAHNDTTADHRLTALLTADAFAVRLTAAIALALRLGDKLPDTALQLLAEARDHTDELDTRRFALPWNRSLLGFAALALHRIGLSP